MTTSVVSAELPTAGVCVCVWCVSVLYLFAYSYPVLNIVRDLWLAKVQTVVRGTAGHD